MQDRDEERKKRTSSRQLGGYPVDITKASYEALLSLAAEMILDEAIRKHREDALYQLIDQALAAGDEPSFQKWIKELKTLQT